jgi:phosphate-selective porin
MENAAPVEAFSPGYKIGIQSEWQLIERRLLILAGLFTDSNDYNIGDATDADGRIQLRTVWIPWVHGEGKDRNYLHLGLSLSHVLVSAGDSVRYRARPESRVAPVLVDTGNIEADTSSQMGLEAIWSKGSFYAMSELMVAYIDDRLHDEKQFFWGSFLSANYILTGEIVPYNPKLGVLKAINPDHPGTLFSGGMGAWELSGRISYTDLSDGSTRGGEMLVFTGGLNWHWNKHVKWMANIGYATTREVPDSGDVFITQLRFQVKY